MKFRISHKLYFSFSLMFLLVLLLGVLWETGLKKTDRIEKEKAGLLELRADLYRMQTVHYKWVNDLVEAVRVKGDFKGQTDPTQCAFGKWYYSHDCPFAGLDEIYKSLEEPHKKLHQAGKNAVEAIKKGRHGEAEGISGNARTGILPELMSHYEPFNEGIKNIYEKQKLSVDETVKKQKAFVYFIMALSLGLVVILAFTLSRLITIPLHRVIKAAGIISSGDLTHGKIDVKNRDELGDLAKVFNGMSDNLKDIIGNISEQSMLISGSSATLAQVSEQSSQTVSQLSSTISQISTATTSVAQNSQSSSSSAQATDDATRKGKQSIAQLVDKMKTIQGAVEKGAAAMETLSSRSTQIGEIVKVITKIADQTNLLSLNAAIEAARAGEAGRGFAVVADEVRQLAESSSKSAEEISRIIGEVQKNTGEAAAASQNGKTEVSAGVVLIENTKENFENISVQIEKIAKQVEQIAAAAEETAASSEEVTATSEEQSASVEEIASSAKQLSNSARILQDIVSKFKVK